MYFRRSRLAALAATGVAALALAACSPAAPEADGPVTIEFWSMPFGGHSEDDVRGYVDEFNDAQDDIVVEFTGLQWADGRDKIIQAVGAGTPTLIPIMPALNCCLNCRAA